MTTPTPFPMPPEEEKSRLARLGVGFDGRYFRYREYRYDRLADAVNYARLDQSRGARPPAPAAWLPPVEPGADEQRLMAELGIAFDGRNFLYRQYRYDRCVDAANYARLDKSREASALRPARTLGADPRPVGPLPGGG